LAETVAALTGPILENKRLEQRWLWKKARDAFGLQLKRLFGPKHFTRKIVVSFLAAAVVFFALFKTDYRVTAPTVIEGAIQRVVAAPYDGYIKETSVRPGDIVNAGDLLGLLDDRELRLERIKWASEREKFLKQYYEAMAKRDRAQISILRARIAQAEAQIPLLDEQLTRSRIEAPFDGFIVSGDLTQALGAPVERGDVLFEVAPLDDYRVIIQVDERDIGEILVGQRSDLMLPSMPGEVFPFQVKKITPVSNAEEGRNFFRVEGELESPSTRLRPGLEGVGKIRIDRRRLIWIWTHNAINWFRLTLWKWIP
jgi:RND family efflux transporter MFP subunit